MKKHKSFVVKSLNLIRSSFFSKYIIKVSICLLILFLFGMFTEDTLTNLLSIFFGFIISNLTVSMFNVISAKFEDATKVCEDTEKLVKIYTDPKLKKNVELNGTKVDVLYKDLLVNKNYKINIQDNPDKMFEPDGFAMDNFNTLMSAHKNSNVINMKTARLQAFERVSDTEFTFKFERSTIYNHLITNRAADYKLESGTSIREYYEYGPDLTPLEKSVMSNHLGIIGLVYLKDGELLLPRRAGNSTISKNKVTSSIATRLNLPAGPITTEYVLKDCILDAIASRTKLDSHYIDQSNIDIEFLGCGQDVYEVGKPHFFYKVALKNIDRKTYITHLINKKEKNQIDEDKYIYVVKKDSIKFLDDYIEFSYYHAKIKRGKYTEKVKKAKVLYEKAFACNIWHEYQ